MVCLLFQVAHACDREVSAAAGTEVCTGEGMMVVVFDGKQLPSKNGAHHDDCCCASLVAIPSHTLETPLNRPTSLVRTEVPVMSAALQWFGPMSRGPPAPVG